MSKTDNFCFKTNMFTSNLGRGEFGQWHLFMTRIQGLIEEVIFEHGVLLRDDLNMYGSAVVFLKYVCLELGETRKELFARVDSERDLDKIVQETKSRIVLVQVPSSSSYRVYVQGQLFMSRSDPVQATFCLIQAFNLFGHFFSCTRGGFAFVKLVRFCNRHLFKIETPEHDQGGDEDEDEDMIKRIWKKICVILCNQDLAAAKEKEDMIKKIVH